MLNSFERLRDAVEAAGLQWKETIAGAKANFQTPGHGPGDFGTSVTYNGEMILIYCFNDDTDKVLSSLGLDNRDLYDNPKGSTYQYPDGLVISRSPQKRFTQTCKHGKSPTKCADCKGKLNKLYGVESIKPGFPIYVVEGEKDVNTAINICDVAAVSQAGGANNNPSKADWSPLAGHDVLIVQDSDKPGAKRAIAVRDYLQAMDTPPSNIIIVQSPNFGDLSDHVAAGLDISELVPVETEPIQARTISLESFSGMEWEVPTWGWEPDFNGQPHGAIPVGSLSIHAGRPGAGKSSSGRNFAAQVSKGTLPGCWYGTPHNVAYIAGEESLKYNVIPSLVASGADMKRVLHPQVSFHAPDGVHEIVPLVPDKDMRELTALLKARDVKLVIVDPLMEYMGGGSIDIYKNDQVRAKVKPWAKLAEDIDGIVIAIMHLNKSGNGDVVAGINGSSAFGEVARSIFGFAKDPNSEDGDRVMSQEKNSIGSEGAAWTYRIEGKEITNTQGKKGNFGTFVMVGDSDQTVGEVLRDMSDGVSTENHTDCEVWLGDYLTQSGATPRKVVLADAAKAGFKVAKTVQRAFKKLNGISGYTETFPRESQWSLPAPSSGDTRDTVPITHVSTVPTVPTGNDLHKRNVPTGADIQQGHKGHTHTTPVPAVPTESTQPLSLVTASESEQAILNVLHPEFAQSASTIKQSLTKQFRDNVPEVLARLVDDGRVIQSGGKYQLSENRKSA